MGAYILRRLLIAIPVLFFISVASFVALRLAPGDPVVSRINPFLLVQMDPAAIEAKRREYGLDLPIFVQYFRWLLDLLRGDLGYSISTSRPILDEIAPRIAPTVLLMGSAIILALVIGIPFGVISAVRQYSPVDYALTGFSVFMIVVPNFVLSLMLLYAFGVLVPVFPTRGMVTLGSPFSVLDLASHLVLPMCILGFGFAAPIMRYTRASVLETLGSDYITTARAKGLRNSVVLVRHALRNSLLPVITVLGLLLPEMVAGAVIVEQIFTWPGMGSLAVQAANDRDPALMMAVLLFVSTAVLMSSLLADIAYGVADPRVRLTGRSTG